MGFLESGFGIFALIMVWNVFLLGFGGVTTAPYIVDQNLSGLGEVGTVSVNLVNPGTTPSAYISPTTTPEENVPFFSQAFGFVSETANFVGKIIFAGADAIEQSAIPAPLNWVLSTIIRIIMGGYIGLFLYTLVTGWKGGGVSGA